MKFVKLTTVGGDEDESVWVNQKCIETIRGKRKYGGTPRTGPFMSEVTTTSGSFFEDDRAPEALIAELCETAQERYWRLSREANPPAETAIEDATK